MPKQKEIQFFLGCNTKRGFVPLFEQLSDPHDGKRMYILKGGPGSGKSYLMKKIGKALEEEGHRVEFISCASDPDSLDAILDYDAKVSIVDGTAPHTLDPKYPGAYDVIIILGEAWNQNELTNNKTKIIELTDIISSCHSMATYCIKAASTLLETSRSIASLFVNREVIYATLTMLYEELKAAKKGTEQKRLLSAVSVGRTVFFDDTLQTLCPKLYIIKDEWGAASTALLEELHQYALSMKLEVITCYCSIESPEKIDHLLFPSIQTGVTTSNSFHSTSSPGIPLDNLMVDIPESDAAILSGNLSTSQNLISTACNHVERAKALHDDLEAFYVSSMDFTKLDVVREKLLKEILHQS